MKIRTMVLARMKRLRLILSLFLACVVAMTVARGRASDPEDCIAYNPSSLEIEDVGEKGWRLRDGRHYLLLLDNREDAKAALALAQQHNYQCFIGRNNRRPDRGRYIVQYWK